MPVKRANMDDHDVQTMRVCQNENLHLVVLRFDISLQVGNQDGHIQKAGCKLSPPLMQA